MGRGFSAVIMLFGIGLIIWGLSGINPGGGLEGTGTVIPKILIGSLLGACGLLGLLFGNPE